MVIGLPGECLDNVQRVAEEVLSTEYVNAITRHLQMEENIAKDLQSSHWSVIHLHVQVNSLSKKIYCDRLTQ